MQARPPMTLGAKVIRSNAAIRTLQLSLSLYHCARLWTHYITFPIHPGHVLPSTPAAPPGTPSGSSCRCRCCRRREEIDGHKSHSLQKNGIAESLRALKSYAPLQLRSRSRSDWSGCLSGVGRIGRHRGRRWRWSRS
jgi:hypothetical protein